MGLKYTNLNNEISLARNFYLVKIEFNNESYELFFQEDALIAPKTRLSINLTKQIQME